MIKHANHEFLEAIANGEPLKDWDRNSGRRDHRKTYARRHEGNTMNQAPIVDFTIDIARSVADQCICHPASQNIDNIERAGEAIKYLLWVIEKTRATAAIEQDRAQRGEPVLWRYRDSEQVIRAMDGYTPGEGWTPLYTAPQPERKPMMDQTAHDMNLVAEKYAHKLALEIGKAMP